jgi:hypothetical protein
MADRLISNTTEVMRHPWPDDCLVQGGKGGIVFTNVGSYRTAFVEAFPGTFLRGEGPTVAEAEDACWARYQQLTACPTYPAHGPFEARNYTNGAGFCTSCGGWFGRAVTGLPELPDPPGQTPSLLERVFTGDRAALDEVVAAITKEEPHA